MTPIRLLLADGYALFRRGLARLLAAESDFEVVGEAADGLQALEMVRELMPDAVLMGVSMPGMNGLEATRRIKEEMPYARIVILTISDRESRLLEAVKSGAHGYFPPEVEPQVLYGTLRRVARGEAPMSRMMAVGLLEEFGRRGEQPAAAAAPAARLTVREREVLQQVARGRTDEEAAAALSIAENAVKNHLKNVLEKVHLEDRIRAATFSVRDGAATTPTETPR